MIGKKPALGPFGLLAIWIAAVIVAVTLHGLRLGLAASAGVAVLVGSKGATRRWLWLAAPLSSTVIVAALLLAPPDVRWHGIPWSWNGFYNGLDMSLRALLLLVATRLLSRRLSPLVIVAALESRAPDIGFAAGMAFNILSQLTANTRCIVISFRQRRSRGWRFREFWNLVLAIFTDVLVNADEMAVAATVRGITAAPSRTLLVKGTYDWLALLLAAVVIVLALIAWIV